MDRNSQNLFFGVSEFVAVLNQTLDFAFPSVVVQGEVSGLRISQNKWVRFKLKDEQSAVDFFGSVYNMKVPLEDGMIVAVHGRPRLSDKYGFSVSFQAVQPVGAGTIKRSFDLLLEKLTKEGLFDADRKRPLPELPRRIGVISSTQAAGYADFIKILNDRFGGLHVSVAHTLVQGVKAPAQIINAINHFNQSSEPPEVIVIVRGGGDPDDLAAFNDEGLVRAIAASRIPTLVGVGHEIDTTLADLAADLRAATPTNAAQLLVPDRRELVERAKGIVRELIPTVTHALGRYRDEVFMVLSDIDQMTMDRIDAFRKELELTKRLVGQYDPEAVLKRGYALVRGDIRAGESIEIERVKDIIEAEVRSVRKK